MICDLCGNNQKATKPVGAFSFDAPKPETPQKGKPADRWNTGASASMEGDTTDDLVFEPAKRSRKKGSSFPVKKVLLTVCILAVVAALGFGAWWFISNRNVDHHEEIADAFKKFIREKSTEYTISVDQYTAYGQLAKSVSETGGWIFDEDKKSFTMWHGQGEEFGVSYMTPEKNYKVTETSERYYNLYLSDPTDFPNQKIVMDGNKCYSITEVTDSQNSYKEMESLFVGDYLDQIEAETIASEEYAKMSAYEKQLYEAGREIQKELISPEFLEKALNTKRVKVSNGIVYELNIDLPELMRRLLNPVKGVVADSTGISTDEYEKMLAFIEEEMKRENASITGRISIKSGVFTNGSVAMSIEGRKGLEMSVRCQNTGHVEMPDLVKHMVAAITK